MRWLKKGKIEKKEEKSKVSSSEVFGGSTTVCWYDYIVHIQGISRRDFLAFYHLAFLSSLLVIVLTLIEYCLPFQAHWISISGD